MLKELIVVKIGGSTLGKNDTTAEDIAKLHKNGQRIIVVHGGAKTINDYMTRLNIKTKFVHGLRVTDLESLQIVTAVLAGLVNKEIVSDIIKFKGRAIGISGADGCFILAKNINAELLYTGEDLKLDNTLLKLLLENNYIPVIAPICLNNSNNLNNESNLINVNGDTVAAEVASAMKAAKLIFLTDVTGLYDSHGKTIDLLKSTKAKKWLRDGIITGGMAVKIAACIDALAKVSTTRIIDGRVAHALLKEIDGTGRGTTIES
jgi:acetylglutamate kinase